ncbi:hypothetical protein LIER_15251 [Lithospermum erythrorhizon]|uniref:Replication factor A C-terminal domain-containing protein n=1 Tax=Lithospermum erythrorhizon TaxID=34254 RepID=A0AAV3Q257_LITER
MAQTNLLISQISIQTRNWTSRLKRYILTDYEGNEVAATVFSEQIPFVMPVLHLFKVYDTTNAQVKFVPPQYRIINNEHHWILQRDTLIQPMLDESPYLRYFSSNLTLFNSIAKNSVPDANNIGMGFLQISEEDQKLYYIRCNNCNSKISASEEGIKYTCYACRKEVLTTARPLVFMSVTDESGTLKVVAIDDIAEQILQKNASDMLRLMNMGQKYDLDTLRYLEDTKSNEACQSSENVLLCSPGRAIGVESSQSPLSPLKSQMSQITINTGGSAKKKLSMVNNDEVDP